MAACQRKRLRFLRFSFTQRTQRKRLRLNGTRALVIITGLYSLLLTIVFDTSLLHAKFVNGIVDNPLKFEVANDVEVPTTGAVSFRHSPQFRFKTITLRYKQEDVWLRRQRRYAVLTAISRLYSAVVVIS